MNIIDDYNKLLITKPIEFINYNIYRIYINSNNLNKKDIVILKNNYDKNLKNELIQLLKKKFKLINKPNYYQGDINHIIKFLNKKILN